MCRLRLRLRNRLRRLDKHIGSDILRRQLFLYLGYLLGDAFDGEAFAQRFGSCEPLLTITRQLEFQLVLVLRSINILNSCGGTVFEEVRKVTAVKHDLSNSDAELFFPRLALLLLQQFEIGNALALRVNE